MAHYFVVALVAGLAFVLSVPLCAQTTSDTDANKAVPLAAPKLSSQPLWEFGVGGVYVRQVAYPGSASQVNASLVLPYFIYRGQVIRAESGGVGLRAIKRPRYELDVGFAGAFGSGRSVPVRAGMPPIGTLGEVGPRLKIRLGSLDKPSGWRLDLPLRAVLDLSDRLTYRGIAFEPKLIYSRRLSASWRLTSTLGMVFGDRRLTSTFYAVDTPFATATRPAYAASAGLITTRLGVSLVHRLTRSWSVRGFARVDNVSGAANRDSPLVEKRSGYTAGIALSWKISESDARASR